MYSIQSGVIITISELSRFTSKIILLLVLLFSCSSIASTINVDFTIEDNKALKLESNNSNFIAIKAPSGITSNTTYVFPSSATSGYLTTDNNGNLSWSAGKIPAIINNAVTSIALQDGSVTEAKLADKTITLRTIAASGYASGLALGIDDNGNLIWTSETVTANSITSLHLTSNAVTLIKLADGAITSSNFIATGTGSFLALNTSGNLVWTSATVDANSITSIELANNAVTSSKIAATGSTRLAPAAALAINYNKSLGDKGYWYLPAHNELVAARTALGTAIPDTAYYWSSTQYNARLAYCVAFNSGGSICANKNTSNAVRAVRAY